MVDGGLAEGEVVAHGRNLDAARGSRGVEARLHRVQDRGRRSAGGQSQDPGKVSKGKKMADKRDTEKKRDWDRQKARLLRERG